MASSTSAAASVPVPEQIVIPQVPDRVTLAQTLQSGDEGILATFTDLYADIFNTATSLSDHVSRQGVTHDMLDTTQRVQAVELANTQATAAQNGARI